MKRFSLNKSQQTTLSQEEITYAGLTHIKEFK